MQNVNNGIKNFQENVPLAPYTTFKIGGPAKYFIIAKSTEEVKSAMEAARQKNIPVFVLGNGSNVLISDEGFDGLVIKIQNSKLKIENDNEKIKIIAESGVLIGKLVNESVKNSLTGLEWMMGIPGTLGGAIVGNAGAFGHSISELVEKVEVLDQGDLSVKLLRNKDCQFGYRESIFKKNSKYIILSAELSLKEGNKAESERIIKEHIVQRQSRHPGGLPNAGSFFKNIPIKENEKAFDKILKEFPEAEKFKAAGMIPAAWLIEKRDLKGVKIGGAMVSDKHANFIVNFNKASARDVMMLSSIIKQKIRDSFEIQLQEEVRFVGF